MISFMALLIITAPAPIRPATSWSTHRSADARQRSGRTVVQNMSHHMEI
jgi:hypothetical protein